MKVNAQITAMTTALEFIGGLSYLIHLAISKGTNLASFIHFQSIYFILVPYAFLMNTSDNKFRVIQNGWRSVFRNIVGKQVTVGEVEQSNAASDKIVTRNKPSTQKENTNTNHQKLMAGTKTCCRAIKIENAQNVSQMDISSIVDTCTEQFGSGNNRKQIKYIDDEIPDHNRIFTITRKFSPKMKRKDKREKSNDSLKEHNIFIERVISNRSEVDDFNMLHTPFSFQHTSSKAYYNINNRNTEIHTLNVHQFNI